MANYIHINIKVAYDSVDKEFMIEKLNKMEVRRRLSRVTEIIYIIIVNDMTMVEVISGRLRTEKGVRKERLLSAQPILIYLDDVEKG